MPSDNIAIPFYINAKAFDIREMTIDIKELTIDIRAEKIDNGEKLFDINAK
jgi:hypothetical protein